MSITESVKLLGYKLSASFDGDSPDHDVQELLGEELISMKGIFGVVEEPGGVPEVCFHRGKESETIGAESGLGPIYLQRFSTSSTNYNKIIML